MDIKFILNKIIERLGRVDYQIDSAISNVDIINIMYIKSREILRGCIYKLFFKKSTGLLFIGRNVELSYCSKISCGKSLTIGNNVKIIALSKNGIVLGNNVSILNGSIIDCLGVYNNIGDGLSIGHNVGIGQNCFIQVRANVEIRSNVIFGPNVSVFSENHIFEDSSIPIVKQGVTRKGVIIEEGVWIGTGAVVLDGVTIGKNSVIAAGSVVNKNVPPFSLYGGVPARLIKNLR